MAYGAHPLFCFCLGFSHQLHHELLQLSSNTDPQLFLLTYLYSSNGKPSHVGLERWRSSKGHLLFLQRTRIQFPNSLWLTTFNNSSSRRPPPPIASSDLQGHQAHTWHNTYMQVKHRSHKIKSFFRKNEDLLKVMLLPRFFKVIFAHWHSFYQ